MDRIKLKELAKKQITGNIGVLFLIILIVYLISTVLSLIPAVGGVLSFIISAIFAVQLIVIFLDLTIGIKPDVMRLFDVFKNQQLCGNSIILYILITVFTVLWSLLLIVPGVIKSLSYSMAPYILAENDYYMTPSDAIKESMRIMNGHKLDLFVLELSFIGWWLLTALTCGILGIYVLPYHHATLANFYNEIKDKPQVDVVSE